MPSSVLRRSHRAAIIVGSSLSVSLTACHDEVYLPQVGTGLGGATVGGGATSFGGGAATQPATTGAAGVASSVNAPVAAAPTPATLIPSADGRCKFPAAYGGDGSLTWYLFSQGSTAVNCSYAILGTDPDRVQYVPYGGGQYFAALNTADYAAATMCGACVEITRDGTRTVTATVVDQCPVGTNPKCIAGHLDLSKAAFLQLGAEGEGYLGTVNGGVAGAISWKYVPCAVQGNLVIRLKEPTNKYWNEFLVENHRNPIAKFEVLAGTEWLVGSRQTYNYWTVNAGRVGLPKQIRITDIHGSVIEAQLDYPPSGSATVELAAQFPACN